jgi:Peroxide stress protein YaaA
MLHFTSRQVLSANRTVDKAASSHTANVFAFMWSPCRPMHTYWRDSVTEHIKSILAQQEHPLVINVASIEYSKAVDLKAIQADGTPVVECAFKDGGKTVTVLTKRARGLLARYAVKQQVQSVDDLKGFNYEGYCYSDSESSADKIVFTRTAEARLNSVPETAKGGCKAAQEAKGTKSSDSAAADDDHDEQQSTEKPPKKSRKK